MKDIRHITEQELTAFVVSQNEKPFKAKQISEWLWKKGADRFDAMNNISIALREKLAQYFTFHFTAIAEEVRSSDQTVKFAFRFSDGVKVEGVLIPSGKRVTACISTQAGCPLKCAFCSTGTMGFIRDLHFSEIFDQYMLMNRKSNDYFGVDISNIVYMGMGEPLLNYDNTVQSVRILTSKTGIHLSPSRITLSTVGIVAGLLKLADENLKIGLAVSLHSADELERLKIMPVTKSNNLVSLSRALSCYVSKTGDRITIEYVLLKNVNDTIADAEKLCRFCKAFPVKINIIEYNETQTGMEKSTPEAMRQFVDYLESKNLIVNVRRSRGKDIAAACGQLLQNQSSDSEATKSL